MVLPHAPLNIYITWHPDFSRGKDYADFLYAELCRDYKNPLGRGLGIPVFFRWQPYENNKPRNIDFSLAQQNAVIVLVDDEMFADDGWTGFFKEIIADKTVNKRVYPVALSRFSYDVIDGIKEQFINLFKITDADETVEFTKRCKKLKTDLLHDLSRLLLDTKRVHEVLDDSNSRPVKLFISHAKKDGETMAMDFRNYMRSETKLNSFFDTNDIANGYDFENEIAGGIKNAVLVVFQTDEYAAREWCRIEVIIAKRYRSPIVIVNAISKGEKRSFPYSGNAPSIRWNNNFDEIIDLALMQMLYSLYNEQELKNYKEMYGPEVQGQISYLSLAPELFDYINIIKFRKEEEKRMIVLYPDPPLGNEEVKLLNEVDGNIIFTTPLRLPGLAFMKEDELVIKTTVEENECIPEKENELLKNLKMGISISDSPDLEESGYSSMHLQDASVEFVRYLLVHGATMIYGGDLREGGFTFLFSELAKLYGRKERDGEYRFKNYFAWPVHLKLNKPDELDFKQSKVAIEKLPLPDFVKDINSSEFLSWEGNEAKIIWAKSLSYMRETMNKNCHARIFLGGQVKGFKGKYPGIIEEAFYALKDNMPVYFIGAYGGATGEIIKMLKGEHSEIINEEHQISDKEYKIFYDYWNKTETEKIDYKEMAYFFNQYGLQQICRANGLTKEENLRLFITNDLAEMIFYVLKGLASIDKDLFQNLGTEN
jgi:hypothetical protein